VVEIVIQGVGLFDFVAGLSKSKAGEIVVGSESRGTRAQDSESQKQFFETSHRGVPYALCAIWVRGKVTHPALNSP
jgi:hypothetical protein